MCDASIVDLGFIVEAAHRELNAIPATIPGDRRPLTYRLAEAQISTVS